MKKKFNSEEIEVIWEETEPAKIISHILREFYEDIIPSIPSVKAVRKWDTVKARKNSEKLEWKWQI